MDRWIGLNRIESNRIGLDRIIIDSKQNGVSADGIEIESKRIELDCVGETKRCVG